VLAAALVLVAVCALTACGNRPTPARARVTSLDAKSGRVLWLSREITHLDVTGPLEVTDAVHSLTVVGTDCTSNTYSGGVSYALDTRTGA
jgi:hypothetical protein